MKIGVSEFFFGLDLEAFEFKKTWAKLGYAVSFPILKGKSFLATILDFNDIIVCGICDVKVHIF